MCGYILKSIEYRITYTGATYCMLTGGGVCGVREHTGLGNKQILLTQIQ